MELQVEPVGLCHGLQADAGSCCRGVLAVDVPRWVCGPAAAACWRLCHQAACPWAPGESADGVAPALRGALACGGVGRRWSSWRLGGRCPLTAWRSPSTSSTRSPTPCRQVPAAAAAPPLLPCASLLLCCCCRATTCPSGIHSRVVRAQAVQEGCWPSASVPACPPPRL
jgi:hypothetical protein